MRWHKMHIKICSTSLVLMEIQIKTTTKYHYTLIKMTKTENTRNTKS